MDAAPRLSRTVCICNARGLHARAAARFVKTAESFDCRVQVDGGGTVVDGHSIMGLLLLAAGPGTALTLIAEGNDAEAALEALTRLVDDGFDEDRAYGQGGAGDR